MLVMKFMNSDAVINSTCSINGIKTRLPHNSPRLRNLLWLNFNRYCDCEISEIISACFGCQTISGWTLTAGFMVFDAFLVKFTARSRIAADGLPHALWNPILKCIRAFGRLHWEIYGFSNLLRFSNVKSSDSLSASKTRFKTRYVHSLNTWMRVFVVEIPQNVVFDATYARLWSQLLFSIQTGERFAKNLDGLFCL